MLKVKNDFKREGARGSVAPAEKDSAEIIRELMGLRDLITAVIEDPNPSKIQALYQHLSQQKEDRRKRHREFLRKVGIADNRSGVELAGKFLAHLRSMGTGVTIPELARKLQISVSFVWQIEAGRTKLPDPYLFDWANSIGTNVKQLSANLLYYYRPTLFQILTGYTVVFERNLKGEEIWELFQAQSSLMSLSRIRRKLYPSRKAGANLIAKEIAPRDWLLELLRNKKAQLGMTQGSIAERLGYQSATTISQIENGRINIRDEKLNDWIDVLQVKPQLFGSLYLMTYAVNMYDALLTGVKRQVQDREVQLSDGIRHPVRELA